MADVFISYSRRDEAFVERLRGALAERGKDVWLDREDIGPAVEWRRELELGIEASDVFAFVISPDSLRSEPCRREREYAASKGKRIVPMLRSEPNGIEVPEELASRNYIFVRTDEEFEPGVAALLAAIDDLPEWARDHTRLLERAEEWDHHQRDSSFLLRGSDLSEAERWLAEQGAHKEPQPTALQTEYLLASRKVATRRQRLTIGAGAVALVVSVALGLVALLQRNEAQDQRDEAVRQAQLAKSRELAAASVATVRTDPWEALELAVDSAQLSPTPESTDALRAALEAPRESAVLTVSGGQITTARFSDSGHVLTNSYGFEGGGAERRWTLETGESEVVGRAFSGVPEYRPARDVSRDGTLRLTAQGAAPELKDARVGTVLLELSRLGFGVEGARAAQFSSDERSFLTMSPDGVVRVWPLTVRRLGAELAVASAIDPRGRRCLTATSRIVVTSWSCSTGAKLESWRFPSFDLRRSFGEDTAVIGFSQGDPRLTVSTDRSTTTVDVESGEPTSRIRARSGFRPQVSPSGALAVRRLGADTGEVVDASTGARVATLDVTLNSNAQDVAFSADEQRVAIFDYDGSVVRVWDLEEPATPVTLGRFEVEGVGLAPSADGSRLAIANETSTELWDVEDDSRVRVLGGERRVNTVAFSADERFLVVGADDGRARIWETSTGRPVADYAVEPYSLAEGSLSADGLLLARGFQGSALVYRCLACRQPAELLELARAELAKRPTLASAPAGLQDP